MDELLMQELMDIYKNPAHAGRLEGTEVWSVTTANPSCGDVISLSARVTNGMIEELRFEGDGCLVSQVYAELLAAWMEGKELKSLESVSTDDVLHLSAMTVTPSRMKCALLGYEALKKIHDQVEENTDDTERG